MDNRREKVGAQADKKPADGGGEKKPASTWVYFFAVPDKASLHCIPGANKPNLTVYRVDQFVPVRGKHGVTLKPNSTLVRLETANRLPPLEGVLKAALVFQGLTQHLEYTSKPQRDELVRRSRAELPAAKDTLAVLIPIRKSAEWWALAHDQRHAHFQEIKGDKGHTAIGVQYAERIYRKLFHTRYSVETTDHDFLTYFEFQREHAGDFDSLLAKLRDPKLNPEWAYVDREYEIRMTKVE